LKRKKEKGVGVERLGNGKNRGIAHPMRGNSLSQSNGVGTALAGEEDMAGQGGQPERKPHGRSVTAKQDGRSAFGNSGGE